MGLFLQKRKNGIQQTVTNLANEAQRQHKQKILMQEVTTASSSKTTNLY
jgi:hypothetical protein